jgi:hypothetical protein
MPDAADAYRRVDETSDLSSGDIAFVSLARTRTVGEGPPGTRFDPAIDTIDGTYRVLPRGEGTVTQAYSVPVFTIGCVSCSEQSTTSRLLTICALRSSSSCERVPGAGSGPARGPLAPP